MMQDKLVSIIMPTYQCERFVGEAIQSVQQQRYAEWELLITDDASTDKTKDIVHFYMSGDSRIRLFPLKNNVGAAVARNYSLSQAKGRYIAFLDSDDKWLPDKLEKQISFMQNNNVAFSFTAYNVINENGELLTDKITVPETIDYKSYLKNTVIGCLTVMLDKQKTGDISMPDLKSSHDMALWLSILKHTDNAYGINEVLASYRVVKNSNTANKRKAACGVWNVYRGQEHLPLFSALYNFCGYAFHAILKRL